MPVSVETYQQVALEDPSGRWELVCGRLQSKLPMTAEHGDLERRLTVLFGRHLNLDEYEVGSNIRLRVSVVNHYVPDLCVVPRAWVRELLRHPGTFEVYDQPAPLVVEIWSPSTGAHDLQTRLVEYQRRRDQEIWYIHPYERTLTAWRLQPDGSYTETRYTAGTIQPVALPGVVIDLAHLFEEY